MVASSARCSTDNNASEVRAGQSGPARALWPQAAIPVKKNEGRDEAYIVGGKATRARVRSRVEHVPRRPEKCRLGPVVRTVGMVRAHNFTRLAWLIQTQQTCARAPLISPKILAIHRPRPANPGSTEVLRGVQLVTACPANPRGSVATGQQPDSGGSAIQAALGGFPRPSRQIWAFRYFWSLTLSCEIDAHGSQFPLDQEDSHSLL